jgi:hypothetical protein
VAAPERKSETHSQTFAASQNRNFTDNAKSTHLCCDNVKQRGLYFRREVSSASDRKEVTMAAIAEVLSTVASRPDPRGCDLPTCPVCADSMVAAEASAYLHDNVISYLWTCDTCGYGFVTKHAIKRFACN